ncbi:MAG: hypothetical protein D3916_15415 [Candidatus Electrothrix sp. MAN1_4]|nr:hypothetical protein [Candidatus Electrothrix sp. MAN1_4]
MKKKAIVILLFVSLLFFASYSFAKKDCASSPPPASPIDPSHGDPCPKKKSKAKAFKTIGIIFKDCYQFNYECFCTASGLRWQVTSKKKVDMKFCKKKGASTKKIIN